MPFLIYFRPHYRGSRQEADLVLLLKVCSNINTVLLLLILFPGILFFRDAHLRTSGRVN